MGDTGSPVENSGEGVSNALVNKQGIRNKRKFLPDASLDIQGDVSMQTLIQELPYYAMLQEKLRNGTLAEGSPSTIEEQEVEEFLKADWDDPIACQLQELLIDNLLTVFKGAVKKICESGYTLEVAEWSILNSGLFHGSKDAVSNVVDGALALLKGEKELNYNSPAYSVFQEMQNLAAYTMLEMIHVLREVRPTLTIAEAMWCLLISDLNLLNACVVDKSEIPGDSSALTEPKVENSEKVQSYSNSPEKSRPENSNQPTNSRARPESFLALQQGKGQSSGLVQISSQTLVVDEKLGGFKKGSSVNSKRDMLRQKAFQLEKSCKGRISKAAFKAKVAAWGSMVMDKSHKTLSVSSSEVMKGTHSKITALAGPVVDELKSSVPAPASPDKDPTPAPNPTPNEGNTVSNPPNIVAISADETDEAVLILVSHKLALEKELHAWSDWANEKVMQATKRLRKDRGELKMLRQEKEDVENFEKEKQGLEETALKRLSDMESALSNATDQIEVANCSVRLLEKESLSLKNEMKGVELEALRSAKKMEDAQVREQEALKKVPLGETEKCLMVERLRDHKHEAGELEKQLEKAKELWDQFKVLLKHEEKEKARISAQVDSIRAKKQEERDQTDKEAENIRQSAEANLHKCKSNIEELQKSISELNLEHKKSTITALNMAYGSTTLPKVTKRLPLFQDNFGGENVKPERECVVCMTEEISVVFLPCAHQMLCGGCSGLHEKQGMNDCPSCRTPIQKRILAQYRD